MIRSEQRPALRISHGFAAAMRRNLPLVAWAALCLLPVQTAQAIPEEIQAGPVERARQLASEGAYREAMFQAHQITDDAQRFALEADLLFQSRSYRASLGRAQEAIAGGVRTPLLFARAIGSALWLGKGAVAEGLWIDFEAAIERLPTTLQADWQAYSIELRVKLDQNLENASELRRKVNTARTLSAIILLAAFSSLLWLLVNKQPKFRS